MEREVIKLSDQAFDKLEEVLKQPMAENKAFQELLARPRPKGWPLAEDQAMQGVIDAKRDRHINENPILGRTSYHVMKQTMQWWNSVLDKDERTYLRNRPVKPLMDVGQIVAYYRTDYQLGM